jgi:hypothetical protein
MMTLTSLRLLPWSHAYQSSPFLIGRKESLPNLAVVLAAAITRAIV